MKGLGIEIKVKFDINIFYYKIPGGPGAVAPLHSV
jgi:hypothetical protein